ncbi:MAG TPA: hypothetical protein VHA37_04310 [Candidatus Saccharimonadales bacterium]|nr:hypothetical protein [Candidatus Saccharimonadales bacterium]
MSTLRRLALASASALGLALSLELILPGAARAGDVTFPQLQAATSVVDNDLIATWRAQGPLTRINASVLATYVQGKIGDSFLQTANALSELTNVQATVRSNLGLGTAATAATGTSGNALCFLNANCIWSGAETFQSKINLSPLASAPGTLANGDVWETSSGVFGRINGATHQFAYLDSSITGNAATATNANNANTVGGVGLGGLVQNNGGTYGINISGTSANANTVGGVGFGGLVQNNGGTYGINITGSAGFANSAGSASAADTANGLSGLVSNLGYQFGGLKIPTPQGTVIINWGFNTSLGGGGSFTDNFTIPYASGAIAVASGTNQACGANVISTSQVTIHNASSGVQNCYWIAIGV